MSRVWLIPALSLLLAPTFARADDELARFAERSRLAVQKLTGEVNYALAQARVLEKSDPARAKVHLERALQQVRDAEDTLPPELRTRMTQQLSARLRDVNETIRQRQRADEAAAEQPRSRPIDRGPAQSPADIARRNIEQGNAQLSALDRGKLDRGKGFDAAIQGTQDAATPIAGNLEFGKDHARRMEIRKQTVGPQMTAKEVALLKALNSTLSVDFNNHQFRQVVDYLSERTGLSIIVDQASLKDAMVEYEDPITFKGNKLAVRTILRKILADRGLSYVIREGTIQVVTAQRARDMMTTRTYPIDDLVAGGFTGGNLGPFFGPLVARQQMVSNAQGIINMIQTSIEPSMWSVNGGPATITFFEPGMALVVRAPAEMHYMMNSSLYGR
jgi:aromatic ring-cleaving dioxygenase